MIIIGSHVGFNKEEQLLGALKQSLNYGSNTFMFYTGAPQNTLRYPINDGLTFKALELMKQENINPKNLIVHAPYIVNLGNKRNQNNYQFSINFLIQECERCEQLFIDKLVLHPGSHVGCGVDEAIIAISNGLNQILNCTEITILLETMAGKGTEIGGNFNEIKRIIDNIDKKDQIGICLDTCHLNDAGYNINNFDKILDELDSLNLLDKVKCIHINDSINPINSHKDRHANIGYGTLGFNNIINIIYNKRLENIPKILETPYINEYPPYKYEIEMIKNKKFNSNLEQDTINYYKK